MVDSRLRELERRWRETGSRGDEVAYLRERARAGDLPGLARELELRERLQRALLSTDPPRAAASILDMLVPAGQLFENRFEPSGHELQACRLIAHAAARRAAELAGASAEVAEALALLERFLASQDPQTAAALTEVAERLVAQTDPMTLIRHRRPAREGEAEAQARAAAGWAADSVALHADPQTGPSAAIDRSLSCAWACELLDVLRDAPPTTSTTSLHEATQEALRRLRLAIAANLAGWLQGDDLLPWAARPVAPSETDGRTAPGPPGQAREERHRPGEP